MAARLYQLPSKITTLPPARPVNIGIGCDPGRSANVCYSEASRTIVDHEG
jgi:hypothetical protein